MLDFADLPYKFVPPRPNRLVIALAQLYVGKIALPGKRHQISELKVEGAEEIRKAQAVDGARFVLLPNHSTHSDPQVMAEVCRRLGIRPSFMAAYDVFARSKLQSWIMQRTGAFSVDREGSDRKSMKCATEIVVQGDYPLILFPEGNVYLCNDQVTPFAEGAAYIALRAQKSVGEQAPVYAVPVSMKFTYLEDIRDAVCDTLANIALSFDTVFDRGAPFADELKRISVTALARYLKQRGHIPPDGKADVDHQIEHAAEQIITSLEAKIGLRPRSGDDLTTRVRKIRAAVHAVRTDAEREVDHRAANHWADEAMLALRILGYRGGYMASRPTLDRVAETVARLREDVHSKLFPPDGRRRCIVKLGTPIDLRKHMESFQKKARPALEKLTELCESGVQTGIDEINASNDELGAADF